MKKRLIDANWVLGEIEHDLGCYEIGDLTRADELYIEVRDVVRMICNAPTVDAVEVVHGRWERVIPTKSAAKWSTKVSCSVCHRGGYTHHNYCPNCGAKMDGEAK